MRMKDRISVIIPTFNRASVLLRAVDSVLKQTYRDIELIIVDDGSTDDTEKLLAPYIDSQTIQYFKTQNKGVSASRNFGVTQAREKWIAFLDSDDEWLSPKLAKQMAFLLAHAHLSIVYSDEVWIRNDVLVNKKNHHQKKGGWIFPDCLKQCLIGPSSVILTKELFDKMEGFDESFVVCEDYDLWLKISSKYEIGYISEALVKKFGGHADQLSTCFVAMDSWRIKSMQNILRDKTLSAENRANVIAMMKEKGQILLKGYIKHGNQEAAHELEKILAQF